MGWRTQALKASERNRNQDDKMRRMALEIAAEDFEKWRREFNRAVAEGEDEDYILDAEYTFVLAFLGVKWQEQIVSQRLPENTKMPEHYTHYMPDRLKGRTPLWMGFYVDRIVSNSLALC